MATPYIMPHGRGTLSGGPILARPYDLLPQRHGNHGGPGPDKMNPKGKGEHGDSGNSTD